MKTSLVLTGASALLAAAAPLEKRVMETDWVYEIVTVTVTADDEPTSAGMVFLEAPTSTSSVKKTHTRRPHVQPAPVVVTTTVPAVPTTSSEAVVVVEPTTTAQAAATTTAVEQVQSTTAATTSTDTDLSDYQSAVVDQHNYHRTNHSAPALVWDATLAQYALNTANTCVFAHDMDQGGGGYGQNLASWGTTGSMDGLKNKAAAQGVTNQWYNDEMENWQYYGDDNPPSGLDLDSFGHFTQVVWKGSTKVGCATVECPAGSVLSFPSWYTVCNYNPPGNYGGEYGTNVLKPLGDPMIVV